MQQSNTPLNKYVSHPCGEETEEGRQLGPLLVVSSARGGASL